MNPLLEHLTGRHAGQVFLSLRCPCVTARVYPLVDYSGFGPICGCSATYRHIAVIRSRLPTLPFLRLHLADMGGKVNDVYVGSRSYFFERD